MKHLMFYTQRRLLGASVIAIMVLFVHRLVAASDLAGTLQQRSALLAAEIGLIEAELALESWQHVQLEELYGHGFASWLEVRRHQLIVDSLTTNLHLAREFQEFLSAVATARQTTGEDQLSVLGERETSPIKVFLPGSVRMIGWLEGQQLIESTVTTTNPAMLKAAEANLTHAQQRFDQAQQSRSRPATWRERASLDLQLAHQQVAYAKALEKIQRPATPATAAQSIAIAEIQNFVTADHHAELKSATSLVAQAEAAAVGQIQMAKLKLDRERRRADALRRLQTQGYASVNELNAATDRVAEIQSQLATITSNHAAIAAAAARFPDLHEPSAADPYQGVDTWPGVVLNDQEYVSHLIDLRREYVNQTLVANNARLKSEMLQQVTARLKQAARQTDPHGDFGRTLNVAQRNEIEAYEIDIELAKASVIEAQEKQRVLIHEQRRFLQQAVAQNNATRARLMKSTTTALNPLGLLNVNRLTGAMVASGSSNLVRRTSYFESEQLDLQDQSSCLVFSQSHGDFIGTRDSADSVNRFQLQPAQSLLRTGDGSRRYANMKSWQIERSRANDARGSFASKSGLTVADTFPAFDNPTVRFHFHARYGQRSDRMDQLYQNGKLRSDLLSRLPPGQIPWYLPGSPTNVRPDDFRLRQLGRLQDR